MRKNDKKLLKMAQKGPQIRSKTDVILKHLLQLGSFEVTDFNTLQFSPFFGIFFSYSILHLQSYAMLQIEVQILNFIWVSFHIMPDPFLPTSRRRKKNVGVKSQRWHPSIWTNFCQKMPFLILRRFIYSFGPPFLYKQEKY